MSMALGMTHCPSRSVRETGSPANISLTTLSQLAAPFVLGEVVSVHGDMGIGIGGRVA